MAIHLPPKGAASPASLLFRVWPIGFRLTLWVTSIPRRAIFSTGQPRLLEVERLAADLNQRRTELRPGTTLVLAKSAMHLLEGRDDST
jgi:hypothetical protein